MQVIQTIAELREYLGKLEHRTTIGLVPTMGALHRGHGSLIERARRETDCVVVSIFVNPLQFAPTEDLQKYPRQLEKDCQYCQELGVDVVFAPSSIEMETNTSINTKNNETTLITPPPAMMSGLCGKFRPNHFPGVATIVVKLLGIVQPHIAYFGAKDAQQLAIIRRVVADLNVPVEIRGCPTIREASGLALSSRNQYLSPIEKERSSAIYRSLDRAALVFRQGERDSQVLRQIILEELKTTAEIAVQYVEIVDPLTLQPLTTIIDSGLAAVACYIGSTRLIDNLLLRDPQNEA
jgi:pantoate ligase / CMP/dCMP kinase